MSWTEGRREIASRYEEIVMGIPCADHGAKGAVLARCGDSRLVWRYAGRVRGFGRGWQQGRIQVFDGAVTPAVELDIGPRFSMKALMHHKGVLETRLPGLPLQQLRLSRTLVSPSAA